MKTERRRETIFHTKHLSYIQGAPMKLFLYRPVNYVYEFMLFKHYNSSAYSYLRFVLIIAAVKKATNNNYIIESNNCLKSVIFYWHTCMCVCVHYMQCLKSKRTTLSFALMIFFGYILTNLY